MKLPETIAGMDARPVRDMFRALMQGETEYGWRDGKPEVVIRRVSPDLIATTLHVPPADAQRIQDLLVAEGWIEAGRFVPTIRGMALSQHDERPRIARPDAEAVLDRVIEWAERVNLTCGSRVCIKEIRLFGSMLEGCAEVGDIDLFVLFTTMDLGLDLEPHDLERECELAEELASISPYLSPTDVIDFMSLDVPSRIIFPAPADDLEAGSCG